MQASFRRAWEDILLAFVPSASASGKLFGEIAAQENGNNLLRMQRQIINFFLSESLFRAFCLTAIYASCLTIFFCRLV